MVDAAVAVNASYGGLRPLRGEELLAPPVMWPEAPSVLHRAETQLVSARPRGGLRTSSAEGKTYDAECLALAQLLRCRTVTVDFRLRCGADRLGLVVLPSEL